MFKNIVTVMLLFLVLLAGCQQSYNQKTSDQYIKEQADSKQNLKTKSLSEHRSSSNTDLMVHTSKKIDKSKQSIIISDSSSENSIQTGSLVSETENKPAVSGTAKKQVNEKPEPHSTPQEKIDQALEFCNYAQNMWEEGKLEEALTNLDSAYYSILEIASEQHPDFNQQKEDIRYLISKRILEIYASRQIVVNGQHNEIPIILNKQVKKQIKRLTGTERKFLVQSLERAGRYRPFILSELKKAGLPQSLSWLPLIESGFKTNALSPARALGLWQFIPSTGYKFGLSRNYYIDERLDPQKATRAAISYLQELHKLFGDWTTALAAYNCGESRVLRIIRKQRINYLDNFWDLYHNLPRETSQYVPKFLATLYIVNNLDKYNIKITNPLSPIAFKLFEIKKQIKLTDIAKEIGVDNKVLKQLNPELRYALLPPETYQLRIPENKAQIFLSKIDKIKSTYSPVPKYVYHRVRRGQTLSGIARKYRTSMRAIMIANHINRAHKIIAGKVLKIPGKQTRMADVNSAASSKLSSGQTVKYKVRQGDNLWHIARKFGTTTKNIMAVNNLSSTRLSIGQKLDITSKNQLIIAKKGTSTYRVRSGDNPFLIAKKHNMDLNRLLALNHLSKKSVIFPGQKLIVE